MEAHEAAEMFLVFKVLRVDVFKVVFFFLGGGVNVFAFVFAMVLVGCVFACGGDLFWYVLVFYVEWFLFC